MRQTLLKWLRRTHLYAGLMLAPWVLVYGMSGFVFNHGEWFSGGDPNQRTWPVDPSAATHGLDADDLAAKAIAALNQRADGGDEVSQWRLRAGSQPRFEGAITIPGEDARGGSVLLVLDPAADEGWTYLTPAAPAGRRVALEATDAGLLRAAQDAMLADAKAADVGASEVRFQDAQFPALVFALESERSVQYASYDLRSGELTLRDPPSPRSVKPKDFITGLHTSHGYPGGANPDRVRTVRAVFVDLMACAMCFWALSGLVMWWQLKTLRRSGWVVIVATLIVVGFVWSGMYRLFAAGG